MPRYLIERSWDVDEAQMPSLGRKSNQIRTEQFPDIVWEHSHVAVDENGTLKTFCIYAAPDEDTVRRHSDLLGSHVIDRVYELGGDVTPDDFPM